MGCQSSNPFPFHFAYAPLVLVTVLTHSHLSPSHLSNLSLTSMALLVLQSIHKKALHSIHCMSKSNMWNTENSSRFFVPVVEILCLSIAYSVVAVWQQFITWRCGNTTFGPGDILLSFRTDNQIYHFSTWASIQWGTFRNETLRL